MCGAAGLETVHVYTTRPAGETEFTFTMGRPYYRELQRCGRCGHFRSAAHVEPGVLYGGDYVSATYGDDGIRAAFLRITSLDSHRSDNAGRVRRVNELAEAYLPPGAVRRLLDVGTGLGVFPHAMKTAGWSCTVIDPDPKAARHAGEMLGVETVCSDFLDVAGGNVGRFDLITFNKVLEHVDDPVAMLDHARSFIGTGGLAYVEVPDGVEAFADDPGREEFFIDHLHVFSVSSTSHLAGGAGFRPILIERLREPSGKYTIRALLRPTAFAQQVSPCQSTTMSNPVT